MPFRLHLAQYDNPKKKRRKKIERKKIENCTKNKYSLQLGYRSELTKSRISRNWSCDE